VTKLILSYECNVEDGWLKIEMPQKWTRETQKKHNCGAFAKQKLPTPSEII